MLRARKIAALFAALLLASTDPANAGETFSLGGACSGANTAAFDWDTGWQCVSGAWARSPLYVGSASAYSCGTSTANLGLLQWTGSALQYCSGIGGWANIGTNPIYNIGLSTSYLSPKMSNGGFYSPSAATITLYNTLSLKTFMQWDASGVNISPTSYTGGYLSLQGLEVLNYVADSSPGASIAIGYTALNSPGSSAAYGNIAVGLNAMTSTLTTAAVGNVAVGQAASDALTSGHHNTGLGAFAGEWITTGNDDTSIGWEALQADNVSNMTGSRNTSVGGRAGGSIDGSTSDNTAIGDQSLYIGVSSLSKNTAIGQIAAEYVSGASATNNTAIGREALRGTNAVNCLCGGNTVVGGLAFNGLTNAANNNTGIGEDAGVAIGTATNNVVIGIAVASTTLTTGNSNILIGTSSSVDTSGTGTSNYISIGRVYEGDASINHIVFRGGSTVSGPFCGTGTGSMTGNDNVGLFTVTGTPTASCHFNFLHSWTTKPVCRAQNRTHANLIRPVSTTSTLTLFGTVASGDVIAYRCTGYQL